MAEESAVKVCIRVRPLIEREEETAKDGAKPVLYWKTDEKSVQQCIDDGTATKCFNFDRVFSSKETTAQLYNGIAKPLVASAVEGYNGTIFAYGQTSSGKTFTMMGCDDTPGVIPLAMEDVFQTIKKYPKKEFLLRVSYMEIYNETVADLLVDNWKRKPLEVREGTNKTVYVADLTEELVTTPAQALAWIRKGEKNRHYEKTKMNQRSSRSHTIFRMILESRENSDPSSGENADGAITVSHLNLVDLAGSERASQTGAEGARFKEGCNINKSLFTLGQVIKKLSEENQRGFTNYRDSKLTRILQNSLGGNAKTVIICTITPATLDETLSTLQFASTAKYMKNDPHVTEVSDDGALLKRYRNEIVDLKRRLQQVSSVTQTTATEKESLFLLLQEKDQLQIEQTDKISKLTRLLVTSTSFVASNKMPKRRVTWGGKLIRLTESSAGHIGPSELSFAEPVTRKRRADMSTLSERGEYDEEFESRWEGPDESFSSFGDSPQVSDKVSQLENRLKAETDQKEEALAKAETLQRRVEELNAQLANEALQTQGAVEKMAAAENTAVELDLQLKAELENRLKAEIDQKEEALAKAETLNGRVEELDAQLANEALLTKGALEKMAAAENTAVELDLQLKAETRQKLESVEKVVMLELRVSDLERMVEEWTVTTSKADEMQKRDDETMQLFDSLVSNQEAVIAEKDHMKQEVEFLKEQAERLEQEKEELSQELAERRELEEFNCLEKDEHEQELKNEISSLKKALESAKCKCQEFEARLSTMSEDLKKQSDWVEELQSLHDKDLVQEVSKLRRSLDDAEGLGLDTKKEWAILRSQNITLKERDVEQTANYEKMEAEVNGLRYHLETEKSRYKKMQVDLQRELNTAFDENTKLTTLLSGKVPKNLIDSVTLEREVTNLKKELTVCQDKEGELHAQLKELSPLQDLPDKVDSLLKQVCELTEALCAVESQRDSLLSGQTQSKEESHQLRDALQTSQDETVKLQAELAAAEQKETHLTQRCADTTEDFDTVRSDLARLDAERSQLLATVQETSDRLNESDEQRTALGGRLNEMQQLIKDLEEKLVDSEQSKIMEEEIGKELQEQVSQLTEELESARAERDSVLSEKVSDAQSSTEEMENLLSKVSSLTEQRDQLKVDLQENVDMVSQLTEELESARAERDGVLSEKVSAAQSSTEEVENLLSKVSSLTEQRDQLKVDLQENVDMNQEIRTTLEENCRQKENIKLLEKTLEERQSQIQVLEQELESVKDERNELKNDLMENVDMAIENQEDLRAAQEKIKQLEKRSCAENVSHLEELQNQNQQLSKELDSARAERDGLFSNASATEEVEKLLSTVTCLTEERDQLKEILEGLRREKNQLRADLEANMETTIENQVELRDADEKMQLLKEEVDLLRTQSEQQENGSCPETVSHLEELQNQTQQLSDELDRVRAERDGLLSNGSATEELGKLLSTVTCLTEERDQLKEILEGLRQEKKQLRADLEANMETTIENQVELRDADEKMKLLKEEVDLLRTQSEQQENGSCPETSSHLEELQNQNQQLSEELDGVRAERDGLLSSASCTMSTVTGLTEERDQLKEILEGLRQEKNQLKADLEANMETTIETQEEARASQDTIRRLNEEVYLLTTQNKSCADDVSHLEELQNQIQKLSEELESVRAERDCLLSSAKISTEELEKLMSRETCLTEERDQLQKELTSAQERTRLLKQEVDVLNSDCKQLEELQNKIQLLSEELDSVRAERDGLLSNTNTATEELEKLMSRVTCLTDERDQLQKDLTSAQERTGLLKQEVDVLNSDCNQLEELQNKIQLLSEELDSVRAERDGLLSNTNTATEELEKLMSRVTCMTDERDQLQKDLTSAQERTGLLKQEINVLNIDCKQLEELQNKIQVLEQELESVKEEKNQLKNDLQETVDKIIQNQVELRNADEKIWLLKEEVNLLRTQNEQLQNQTNESQEELKAARDTIGHLKGEVDLVNAQSEKQENKSRAENVSHLEELQNQIEQLSEELDIVKIDKMLASNSLDEANEIITLLRDNIAISTVQMSSRLTDSVEQLQNDLHEFHVFMDICSSYPIQSLQEAKQVQLFLINKCVSLHKPTKEASTILTRNVITIMHKKRVLLKSYAQDFKRVFKDLFQIDLDMFEEKRLQDVLMCRAQATSFSVTDGNLPDLWQHRLTELLDKRHFYLQKVPKVLEKLNLWRVLTDTELSEELRETELFNEQLRTLSSNQHLGSTSLDSTLSGRVQCRSAELANKKRALEALRGEICPLFEEVKVLRGDAAAQLRQERSNTATLLQTRESAPIKTECGLLQENQQLILQLQQSEKQLEAMLGQMKQLEQAQVNATSTHKEVTQLLQTQLQDAYAEVQTLKDKLQSVERTTQPPGVMEMKRLKAQVVKMELDLTSQSTAYEERIQSLNEVLDEKATELRQLKIKLRTAQQEEECSFLQGKDLHYKLSKAKGANVQSSTLLEKHKLEEEVQQLQSKITDLESQVLSQQKETAKWKGRAVMLKEKTKASGADKPPSPCTPTKRLLPVTFGSSHLNSPKKRLQDSPKKFGSPRKIPDSPKTTAPGGAKGYFDLDSASEPRSKNQFQFFDNSSLGSTAGAEKTEEWWPMSPKQSEVCKTQ